MRSFLVTATAIAALATSAAAQTPPTGPAAGQPNAAQPPAMATPGGPMGGPGAHPPPHGPMGPMGGGPMGAMGGGPMGAMMGHGWMHHMHRPPSKAAHFYFKRGDAVVDVKCADDESMNACVDATATLLAKLHAEH